MRRGAREGRERGRRGGGRLGGWRGPLRRGPDDLGGDESVAVGDPRGGSSADKKRRQLRVSHPVGDVQGRISRAVEEIESMATGQEKQHGVCA